MDRDHPLDRAEMFRIMRILKPHLILTIGRFKFEMTPLNSLPFHVRRLWVHWNEWTNIHPYAIMVVLIEIV